MRSNSPVTIGVIVVKDGNVDQLLEKIRSVVDGTTAETRVLAMPEIEEIADSAAVELSRPARSAEHDEARMTAREREIVGLIGAGLSTKEIASTLHIATHTVRTHVGSVLKKLELHTRLQIAAYVAARGMRTSNAA